MNWFVKFISSSIGKKMMMALTGLFLISFLVVHCAINALIFYNDGGKTFNIGAHFMGTNPIIRTIEIVLIAGLLWHIGQGLYLWKKNRDARPVKYLVNKGNANSTWYSRSMALMGTIILLFLVVHTSNFWIPNRTHQFFHGEELPLYDMMQEKFQQPIEVIIYLIGCFALYWHLLHGFKSAFQSLGLNHVKYNGLITFSGVAFSIVVPFVLAMMPVAIYFRWIT
ncbi:succinate dehydrogenase cytochrome b subunit [Chitinophaga niabensis]|uniref:Succinate dehydrogenase / fumarate reductase cytochrome b subunit n=1 Tax=Chitinophaga niabensis TaxID=536979 RepID=A0A1N6DDA2_9BACT|nr:succinate dehydrogenase cytochrome b subunit [Chitinophaga niabensis]SIN68697.1 succinate dehydrogenase / fumarate reductase cytochrome b subunit [Chitinophaga niabensis]